MFIITLRIQKGHFQNVDDYKFKPHALHSFTYKTLKAI